MTASDAQTLVDYSYWARDRIIEAVERLTPDEFLRPMGSSFSSVRDTLAHIYSAECVWLSRWRGQSPTEPLAPDRWPDLSSLRSAWRDLEGDMRTFVAGLGDEGLARVVDYRLMNGQPGRSAYGQMLQHVVNHGTYHRGQVTTLLRQLKATPPKSTDLITFFRERA